MSDAPAPTPSPTPTRAAGGTSLVRLGVITVGLLAVAGGVYAYVLFQNPVTPPPTSPMMLTAYLQQQGKYVTLADGLTDADGDLLADPPADKGKLIDPQVIKFTVVGTDDPDKAKAEWGGLMELLGKVTNKKVEYLQNDPPPPAPPAAKVEKKDGEETPADEPAGPPDLAIGIEGQVSAVKGGGLHVTAFNTGLVERAVNQSGFVPLFCPADKDGKYTINMDVIAPAGGPVQAVSDVRGQSLAFVAMSSNSGGKAPLVLFKEKAGLLPLRDYQYVLTGDHLSSIYGVAVGRNARLKMDADKKYVVEVQKGADGKPNPGDKFAAACVASDFLAREMAAGRVKKDDVRVVDSFGPFPALCFGVPHNLHPDLRAKVEQAFRDYQFREGNPTRVKFARVNYKDDWKAVREIDAKLKTLLGDAK